VVGVARVLRGRGRDGLHCIYSELASILQGIRTAQGRWPSPCGRGRSGPMDD
jgi:hypothetical protein